MRIPAAFLLSLLPALAGAADAASPKDLVALEAEYSPGFGGEEALAAFEALAKEAASKVPAGAAPMDALEHLHRWLFKEKRWEVAKPLPGSVGPVGHPVFLSQTILEGRGGPDAVAACLFLLARRAGVDVKPVAAPGRLLLAAARGGKTAFLDVLREAPVASREEILQDPSFPEGWDLPAPMGEPLLAAYLRSRIGLWCLHRGEWKRATVFFGKALASASWPDAAYGQALALIESGEDLQAAEEALAGPAQSPSPWRAAALAQIARIRLLKSDVRGAETNLAKAEAASAREPWALHVRGLLAERQGDWDAAASRHLSAQAGEPASTLFRAAALRAEARRRIEAAAAAGEPAEPPVPPARNRVLDLLEGSLSEDETVRQSCIAKLLALGTRGIEGFEIALGTAPARVRRQAVRLAANALRDRRAHVLIGMGLRDPDLDVRREAVRAAAEAGAADLAGDLWLAATDPASPPDLAREAAHALLPFGPPTAEQKAACAKLIVPDAAAHEAESRLRAYRSLGITGGDEALAALRKGLKDADPKARLQAVESVGRLGEDAAIDDLIAALSAAQGELRAACAKALERITRQPLGEDPQRWAAWRERSRSAATR